MFIGTLWWDRSGIKDVNKKEIHGQKKGLEGDKKEWYKEVNTGEVVKNIENQL